MDNHWSTSQSGLPLLWCQLPSDDSLQLVEGGRARAVHLGLQVAREAEVKGGEVGGTRNLLPALQRPPADYVLCLQTGCPDTSCWHLCSGLKLQQGDSFFWWTVETDIEPGTTWYISQQNNKNTTTKSRNPTQKNIGRCTVKLPTILNHMAPEFFDEQSLNRNPRWPSCYQKISYWISHQYLRCICHSRFPLNSVFLRHPVCIFDAFHSL